uniref:Uncharacterized protein n=1 Tax=Cereibacter sphaeroides (strain ATCC 17025 / ATH 2.4.3) TaxID=349102 RepID=A4WTR5_CERS5
MGAGKEDIYVIHVGNPRVPRNAGGLLVRLHGRRTPVGKHATRDGTEARVRAASDFVRVACGPFLVGPVHVGPVHVGPVFSGAFAGAGRTVGTGCRSGRRSLQARGGAHG